MAVTRTTHERWIAQKKPETCDIYNTILHIHTCLTYICNMYTYIYRCIYNNIIYDVHIYIYLRYIRYVTQRTYHQIDTGASAPSLAFVEAAGTIFFASKCPREIGTTCKTSQHWISINWLNNELKQTHSTLVKGSLVQHNMFFFIGIQPHPKILQYVAQVRQKSGQPKSGFPDPNGRPVVVPLFCTWLCPPKVGRLGVGKKT